MKKPADPVVRTELVVALGSGARFIDVAGNALRSQEIERFLTHLKPFLHSPAQHDDLGTRIEELL